MMKAFSKADDDDDGDNWKRNGHILKKHPNKHQEDVRKRCRDEIFEQKRKHYEGVRLGKKEFVVGMWLIYQRLKGKKLPVKVSESMWFSARRLTGVKYKKNSLRGQPKSRPNRLIMTVTMASKSRPNSLKNGWHHSLRSCGK